MFERIDEYVDCRIQIPLQVEIDLLPISWIVKYTIQSNPHSEEARKIDIPKSIAKEGMKQEEEEEEKKTYNKRREEKEVMAWFLSKIRLDTIIFEFITHIQWNHSSFSVYVDVVVVRPSVRSLAHSLSCRSRRS